MFAKRISWRPAVRWGLPVLLLVSLATAASAQRTHFGFRVGANFDSNDILLGAHLTAHLTDRLELYPSFDFYFPDDGTLLGFNGDLKYSFPTGSSLSIYAGGGLNLLYFSNEGESDTDVGANLIGGFETRGNWRVHPFVEGRVLIHDNSSFQLVGGINITLGN
jgi:hypothetical protein